MDSDPENIEFGVLGPLAVWRGGTVIAPPGGPVVRGTLCALLLADGRPLSPTKLAELAWSERATAVRAGAVQVAVSRLRRWLGEVCPSVAVEHGVGGYTLTVDPLRTDIGRFRRLVGQAGTAQDAAARFELLGQALALWRGELLADIARPSQDEPLRREIELLRRGAVVAFGASATHLGQPQQAVPELHGAVARNPFDEALHATLIETLAASGNQAEALVVHQRLRDRLATELGVDPGERVQQVYLAVLRQQIPLARPTTPRRTEPGWREPREKLLPDTGTGSRAHSQPTVHTGQSTGGRPDARALADRSESVVASALTSSAPACRSA
jgi:DNA-binding SARP family transcriptional activator